MSVRSRGSGGEAVAAAGGVGFPSLTALRRSNLLVVFQVFTDEPRFVCHAWLL
jgi:hypothetical protein